MTKFPVDGKGRLGSTTEHPSAALTGLAGGDLSGAYPNPSVSTWAGQSKAAVVSGNLPASVVSINSGANTPGGRGRVPKSTGSGPSVAWEPVPYADPYDYGYDPLAADTSSVLNATLAALGTTGGAVRLQPAATYPTLSSVLLPQFGAGFFPTYIIEGNGATIKKSGADTAPILTHTFPANQTDAGNMTVRRIKIRDLIFDGSAATGATKPKGLQLAGVENPHIEDCTFFTCSSGLELTFSLCGQVNNCEAYNCATYGFVAQSGNGLWTGATVSNSPSNQMKFQSCRNYALAGMTDAFHIYGSNGVAIDQCTCEGFDPVNNIYFDSANDGTVKNFSTRGCHFENSPSGANIVLKASGRCLVEAPWVQEPTIMIDASNSYNEAVIEVRSLAWVPAGAQFKCNPTADVFWLFDFADTEGGAAFDPTSNAKWANGTAPQNLHALRRGASASGAIIFNGGTGTSRYGLTGQIYSQNAANETTSATAGANGAVPAQVKGYLSALDSAGTAIKIPYFAA